MTIRLTLTASRCLEICSLLAYSLFSFQSTKVIMITGTKVCQMIVYFFRRKQTRDFQVDIQ